MIEPRFWWEAEEGKAHEVLYEHVQDLEEDQREIHERNLRHAHLYANQAMVGLGWTTKRRDRRQSFPRSSDNMIQSGIDTAMSMIAKNRPKATFLTDGAEWSDQRRAKLLDKFVFGCFQSTKIYEECVQVFRDAAIFGTGCLKVYVDPETSRMVAERVMIDEILVDERECRYGEPLEIHQRYFVEREVLKYLYPEHEKAIEDAHSDGARFVSYHRTEKHMVPVIETYRLAPKPRRTVIIQTATLEDDLEFDGQHPFCFYRWRDPICGFYGHGIAEQLLGKQLRLNQIVRFIQKAQDLIAVPRVFVDVASKTLKFHINNEIGAIVPYRGKPPVFHTPQAVGQEIYAEREALRREMLEDIGISRLSAHSAKPGGLESAVALREFNDIETQRFSIQAQRYEGLYLQAARKMVLAAKKYHGSKRTVVSFYSAKKFVQKIPWGEVDLDEDRFEMQIESSSLTNRTPAGRLQSVIEMAQAGLITTAEARRLLDHPDLERQMDIGNAALENLERTIERLLDGEYAPPEPFQDLQQGLVRIQMAALKEQDEGAPEEILELFRRWLTQAQQMLQPPAPPEGSGLPPEAGAPAPGPIPAPVPGAPPPTALSVQAAQGGPLV